MPRKARGINKSGFFHIMTQGINKEYIFNNNYQKQEYINLMKKYKEKQEIKIIAYCIMDNHAHILMHSHDINEISQYMKKLNGAYGLYYNKTNERVGFVYRNRYQSQFITDIDYLKKCIKYIHMNPVKANIVNDASQYRYSSYHQYIKNSNSKIIDIDLIKTIFKSEHYLQKFLKLKDEEIEIMDVDREEENFKIAVRNYLENQKIMIKDIIKNKKTAKEFCKYIKQKGYKQKQIADLLKVSESKISKILKE